jgi:hypothetical protein
MAMILIKSLKLIKISSWSVSPTAVLKMGLYRANRHVVRAREGGDGETGRGGKAVCRSFEFGIRTRRRPKPIGL